MTIVSATEARQTLPSQLDAVEAGQEVRITRHGKVVAVLVSPTRLANPRAQSVLESAARLRAELEEARSRPFPPSTMSAEYADELVAQIRADRDTE